MPLLLPLHPEGVGMEGEVEEGRVEQGTTTTTTINTIITVATIIIEVVKMKVLAGKYHSHIIIMISQMFREEAKGEKRMKLQPIVMELAATVVDTIVAEVVVAGIVVHAGQVKRRRAVNIPFEYTHSTSPKIVYRGFLVSLPTLHCMYFLYI